MDVASLVEEYANHASLYGQALDEGVSRKANQEHALVTRIYDELRTRGKEGEARLLELFEHANPAVRCWAAAHALKFAPEQAEQVLSELTSVPGFIGTTAEILLVEWRNGEGPGDTVH